MRQFRAKKKEFARPGTPSSQSIFTKEENVNNIPAILTNAKLDNDNIVEKGYSSVLVSDEHGDDVQGKKRASCYNPSCIPRPDMRIESKLNSPPSHHPRFGISISPYAYPTGPLMNPNMSKCKRQEIANAVVSS